MLNTNLKSFGTIVILATTYSSMTLSLKVIGLLDIPTSAAT